MNPGCADLAGIRATTGAMVMITRQYGLFARRPRAANASSADAVRERERLRRELLRRILDREVRRQALRGVRP
jgi:hypothetical protein